MIEMKHRKALRLIQEPILSAGEQAYLNEHMSICSVCRQYTEIHQTLQQNLALQPVRTRPTESFRAAILKKVRGRHRRNLIMKPVKALAGAAILFLLSFAVWFTVSTFTGAQPLAGDPTPTPGPQLADSIDDIVGFWTGPRCDPNFCYDIGTHSINYGFFEDGVWAAGYKDELSRFDAIQGKFLFEGSQLHLQTTYNTIHQPGCKEVGKYQVHIRTNGNLFIELIDDPCLARSNSIPGVYWPHP